MTGTLPSPVRRSVRGPALRLALAGGAAFWVANLLISLTPVAADYRAALSISYASMLLEALVGGLLIAFCVAYGLFRFHDAIPGRNPLVQAGELSLLALVLATLLLEVPAKFLTGTPHALRYFLIGLAFNVIRLLALGLAVGGLFTTVDARQRPGAGDARRRRVP